MRPINPKAKGLRLMLDQVRSEEVEYEPGYWVWQMETEIRDSFIEAINEWGLAQEVVGDEIDRRLKDKELGLASQ